MPLEAQKKIVDIGGRLSFGWVTATNPPIAYDLGKVARTAQTKLHISHRDSRAANRNSTGIQALPGAACPR